jgi:hypothetical protein
MLPLGHDFRILLLHQGDRLLRASKNRRLTSSAVFSVSLYLQRGVLVSRLFFLKTDDFGLRPQKTQPRAINYPFCLLLYWQLVIVHCSLVILVIGQGCFFYDGRLRSSPTKYSRAINLLVILVNWSIHLVSKVVF